MTLQNEQRTFEDFLDEEAVKMGWGNWKELTDCSDPSYAERKHTRQAAQRFAAWKFEQGACNAIINLPTEDIKRWFQLLVGIGEEAMRADIKSGYTFSGLPVEQGQKADGWISVEDSLPAYGMNVLIFNTDGGMHICYRGLKKGMTDGEWRYGMTSSKYNMSHIEYWQPLPALPLQVNKDNNGSLR